MNVTAFLPCRAGSERVIKKNTRLFGEVDGGLTAIKIRQLAKCPLISEIIVSTDDTDVMSICQSVKNNIETPIRIVERPKELALSSTSTDDLIRYVPSLVEEGIILWTHVTSPFIETKNYQEGINLYRQAIQSGTHDSLMSVTPIQTFIWNNTSPVNYNRDIEKWPRTQTLPQWYEVNSGMFIIDSTLMNTIEDRIGYNPLLLPMDNLDAFDIDTEQHFLLADNMWKSLKKNHDDS